MKVEDPKDRGIFGTNEQQLKHFVDKVDEPNDITLLAPIYLD